MTLRRFNTGDYVYHCNTGAWTSLDSKAKPAIYWATEVKPTGIIVLKGGCGTKPGGMLSNPSESLAGLLSPLWICDMQGPEQNR